MQIVIAVVVALTTVVSAPVAAQAVPTVKVFHGDLDLNSAAEASTLYNRVEHAARTCAMIALKASGSRLGLSTVVASARLSVMR